MALARIHVFQNYAIFLQPQGDPDLGVPNNKVSCTSMSKLSDGLMKLGVNGQTCFAYNPWRKGSALYIYIYIYVYIYIKLEAEAISAHCILVRISCFAPALVLHLYFVAGKIC